MGKKEKNFCYAGDWSFVLNYTTGIMHRCHVNVQGYNIFANPEKRLSLMPLDIIANRHAVIVPIFRDLAVCRRIICQQFLNYMIGQKRTGLTKR